MEEQIWARSVIGDKAKIVKNRKSGRDCMHLLSQWFTHLSAFSVRGLIEKHFFPWRLISSHPLSSPPPLSSAPLLSLAAHVFFNLPLYFQEIASGSAELTFSPLFFHSLFYCFPSIISHSCFPSALDFLSCIWSRGWQPIRVMQTHALLFFFLSFVFVFHLHPALALLNLYHVTLPPLSCIILSFFVSSFSGYFLTWEFHLPVSVFQVNALSSPLWKLLSPACWERRRVEEWGLWAIFSH